MNPAPKRVINFTSLALVLYTEESDHNGTPWVSFECERTDGPGKSFAKRIIGLDAAGFIAWAKRQTYTDGNHAFVAGEMPEQIEKHLPEDLRIAPAGSLQILRYLTAVAHEGNPTSAA